MSRHTLKALGLIAASGLLGLIATPAFPETTPRASIPFANHGGIRNWVADGTQGIWVQANSGQWFYANFSFPCTGLPFTTRLRFKTGPFGELDRWGSVKPGRDYSSCNFVDFKASDKPLRKRGQRSATQALAALQSKH